MTTAAAPLFAQVYAFIVGACAGSFLNVCIVRWPIERSIVKPRSRCPKCGNQLAWFENVPILSWVALRGRCRCCDESISMMYPIIELGVALGWLLAVHEYGVTLTALRLAVFGTVLLGVAVTDAKHYLIPDGFTLFGLSFALVTSVLAFFHGETQVFASPYDALVGACAGAGMIAIVGWLGEVMTKREAMGLGDVTLMAFVGAALGPTRALITVFLGATLGAVTFAGVVIPVALLRRGHAREQTELALGSPPFETPLVPFGVFLAPAALLTLFWGDALLGWITRA
ncbi:MAG TPA: prepilin peptidase [Gemmatimonadaceae bacterium]|nr:prepilin peptidase [Gemmatimonadaceae bacterium]